VRGVRRALLERIEAQSTAEPFASSRGAPAADGFVKYLFELDDGARIEAVRIPVPCEAPGADTRAYETRRRSTSSASLPRRAARARLRLLRQPGELGFQRNLQAAEIVGQVLAIRAEADRPCGRRYSWDGRALPQLRRGDPRCPHLLSSLGGCIDARSITVSTAGIVPQIRRFTAEGTSSGWPCRSRTPCPASGCG